MGKEGTWHYTNCAGCYANCGIKVLVKDGVMVKIEGIQESDMGARGGVCGKGAAMLMSYYDPNRCNYPVKRTNPRKGLYEDPKWERISWDEALDTITERLKEIKKRDPNRLLVSGTPSPGSCFSLGISWLGFWFAFGCFNVAPGGVGTHCGNSAHFGAGLYYASWDLVPDFRFCNYALLFGSNQGTASGHSTAALIYEKAKARARGFREIVFDPMCHFAGGKATEWYPISPGTDSAVILTICNLIVNEIGIFDVDFIRNKTNGPYLVGRDRKYIRDKETGKPLLWDRKDNKVKTYDNPGLIEPALEGDYEVYGIKCHPSFQLLKEHLKKYEPTWASEVSGVPDSVIRRIAREWVEESRIGSTIEIEGVKLPFRPVAAGMYRGAQGHTNGFHQFMSVCLLNTLAGNLDVPGGSLGWPARSFGFPETDRPRYEPYAGYEGMLTPGMWFAHDPWPPKMPKLPENVTLRELFTHQTSCPYPYADDFDEIWTKVGRPREVEAMAIYGVNLARSTHNPKSLERFLAKVPFIFSLNTIHNETTEGFADIVLPDGHAFESLDIVSSIGYMFNYPTGMNDWGFHLRMPVVKPKYERRELNDILFDLADRLGHRSEYNSFLDTYISGRLPKMDAIRIKKEENYFIRPEEKITNEEFVDRAVKCLFGKEHGLEYFRKRGFIRWKKKVEEAYWRPFINARVPVYFEFLEHEREIVAEVGEKIGLQMDWERFTPLLSYFPPLTQTKVAAESEFDMIAISYRDVLHTGTWTVQNPWIDEMSRNNPYSYNIAMNLETAKKKGIKEGDMVCLETPEGFKTKGVVKLMKGIHPNVVAMSGHTGGWAKGQPGARGKGPYFNNLLFIDQKAICPVSGSIETSSRVKVYKI